jgi:AcrR family transcriptional regulator
MKNIQQKNKKIQTVRMMSYFIDATAKIIEEEGIENVTIRKVADIAGYNSATIYNYFEDLSHLIFFASMKFMKDYTRTLPEYISDAKNPLEKYLLIWECFCKYSFASPQIYYAIFSSDLGVHPAKLTDYYDYFPGDIISVPDEFKTMIIETNVSKRTRIALEQCVKEGYIKESDADQLADTHYLIWQGALTLFINNRSANSVQEVTEMTLKHIRNTMPEVL